MEQKSNEFIVNLKSLNTQGNRELEKFAKDELINIDDVIKIINSEAERNKINEIAKVTFETLEDDSFQIVVESYEEKQKNKKRRYAGFRGMDSKAAMHRE